MADEVITYLISKTKTCLVENKPQLISNCDGLRVVLTKKKTVGIGWPPSIYINMGKLLLQSVRCIVITYWRVVRWLVSQPQSPAFQLTPGASYTVQQVADEVQRQVGAKPEIVCSKNKVDTKKLQLWEIRLCYNKEMPPTTVRDCPKDFSGRCRSLQDSITFPNPPSSSDEMENHLEGIGSEFRASDEK
ncbi:hypothetical protein QQP08_024015 [Theobroma cacao]|nr:hypothetical protein QQP08_024015 [Theobroma cacao]